MQCILICTNGKCRLGTGGEKFFQFRLYAFRLYRLVIQIIRAVRFHGDLHRLFDRGAVSSILRQVDLYGTDVGCRGGYHKKYEQE